MVERPSRVLAALVGHAWLPVALAFAALGGGAGALVSPSFELTGAASTVGAPLVPSALEVDPPVVVGPTLTPSSLMRGDIVTVSASATDATGVAGISLSTGDWPWIPMSSGDGAWGGLAEDASATIGGPAAVAVAVGQFHTCIVLSDGRVRCTGNNASGQLGNNTTTNTVVPVAVRDITTATAVGAGSSHSCAVLEDGSVRCWGDNAYGQLGNNSTVSSAVPVVVSDISTATAVVAAQAHSCALLANGSVKCWGGGSLLGNGSVSDSPVPVAVRGIDAAIAIAAGSLSTCALLSDGTVRCWGSNSYGQLGNGTTTAAAAPVPVTDLTAATGIGAGAFHACAVRFEGSVVCWGENSFGQLGTGSVTPSQRTTPVTVNALSGASTVAGGAEHTCATLMSGGVRCWGRGWRGQLGNNTGSNSLIPVVVDDLTTAVDGAAGFESSCALRADGTVRCWGSSAYGGIGDGNGGSRYRPSQMTGVTPLVPGTLDVCIRSIDSIGINSDGRACASLQVTDSISPTVTELVAPSSIARNDPLFYRLGFSENVTDLSSGDLVLGGTASGCSVSVNGAGRRYVIALLHCAGGSLSLSLRAGAVVDLGGNPGPATDAAAADIVYDPDPPVVGVPTLTPAIDGCGGLSICPCPDACGVQGSPVAISATSTDVSGVAEMSVRVDDWPWSPMGPADTAWGGQTETGSATTGGPTAIAAGGDHSCAIVMGGMVRCWGEGGYGQLGSGQWVSPGSRTPVFVDGLSGAVGIATGQFHTCAVRSDGHVRCWGSGQYGQLGNGSYAGQYAPVGVADISTATAVAAGYGHTCALLLDHTVRCWGNNWYGQLGNDSTVSVLTPVPVRDITTATAIAAGLWHTCALLVGGSVRCWGDNTDGQLGTGNRTSALTPVPVIDLSTATAIAAGGRSGSGSHTCALRSGGTVVCWGSNDSGRLGDGTQIWAQRPVLVRDLTSATSLAAGGQHTCAVSADQTVRCWGSDVDGQLGDGTTLAATPYSAVPAKVVGLEGVTAVAAGQTHTCALPSDASVVCWGSDGYGQLGDDTTASSPLPVQVLGTTPLSAGAHRVCVRATDIVGSTSGGNACATLAILDPARPAVTGFVAPASPSRADPLLFRLTFSEPVTGLTTGDFSVGGTSSGCVVGVGGSGQRYSVSLSGCRGGTVALALRADSIDDLGGRKGPEVGATTDVVAYDPDPPTVMTPVSSASSVPQGSTTSIFASATDATGVAALSLRVDDWPWSPMASTDGTWGRTRESGSASTGGPSAIAIAAATFHVCALLSDGTVRCWGSGYSSRLGSSGQWGANPLPVAVTDLTGATAIGAGMGDSCAVRVDGTVWCWGLNSSGQLGRSTPGESAVPLQIPGIAAATAVAVGFQHACALLVDQSVRCWGDNTYGQLGDGTNSSTTSPVAVRDISTATALVAGTDFACALLVDRTVRCWGRNFAGQLGNGTFTASSVPVVVRDVSTATAVSAGDHQVCAVLQGGAAKCWGYNNQYQLGDGTSSDRPTPVSVLDLSTATSIATNGTHSCARLIGGAVRCWGSNGYGQLGSGSDWALYTSPVPVADLSTATAVSLGQYHSCAVLSAGVIRCWGQNDMGYLGDGTLVNSNAPVQTLRITPLLPGDHRICVRGRDLLGTVSDGAACTVITVNPSAAPVVVASPASVSVSTGTTVAFAATATGSPTPTVRWQLLRVGSGSWEDVVGPGADATTYSFTATTGDGGRRFRAVFTNVIGAATSNDALLTVFGIPAITGFSPTSASAGTTVTITGTNLTNATKVTFNRSDATSFTVVNATTIIAPLPSDATTGQVRVVTAGGSATSTAVLQVIARLSVAKTGTGTGSVSTTPAGIACGASCSATSGDFTAGSVVRLTATVATGIFAGWSGACSATSGPCDVLMSGARFVTAGFHLIPTISGLSPTSATTGTVVTITGTNLTGATKVSFNRSDATSFTVVSATTITAPIPPDATTGQVRVTTPGGTAISTGSLTVNARLTVAKSGTGSGTVASNPTGISCGTTCSALFGAGSIVTLTPSPATGSAFAGWSGACSATSGPCSILMSGARSVTAAFYLIPTVTGFSPSSGSAGSLVTITGTNLTGATKVTFNRTDATSFTLLSATSISAPIPPDATTGLIRVTTPAGTATSTATLTIYQRPTVGDFSPGWGPAGTAVTVSGSNFAGVLAVGVGGVETTAFTVSGSSLVFIVPRSASNGLVTVRNPAGTGSSSTIFTVTPMPAPLLVAAGGSHSCATFTDGTLRCWGLNTWGQLGDGSTATRISPVVVRRSASDGSAMTGVRSLAAGGSTSAPAFTCVALTDGTARCWGANGSGQLGIGATTPAQITTPVVVRTSAAVAGPLSGVRQVSAGLGHACAALTDGTAVCWGANASGQLGNSAVTTSTSTSPVQVIVSTGVPLRGIVAIVAGVVSTCASITDGTVRCWGANSFGQLGNGATSNKQTYVPQVVRAIGGVAGTALTGVATVAVGRNHACAALTVGTAVCWGSDTAGQLGDGRTTQAQTSPVSVSDGSSIMRAVATIATGENHSCAALTDGTVRCWGLDDAGQLGIGIINSVANPRPASVSDGTSFGGTRVAGATRIACGSSHTLVLVPGAIAGWGENGSAQLGDGTQTRRLVPWLVIGY